MPLWTSKEIAEIFNCQVPTHLEIKGVSIDSRTLQSGDLFFALKTSQADGHAFCQEAAEKGASAVVVSHPIPHCSCPQLLVGDTLKALQILGRYGRLRSKAKIIAVTGSVGKTTTKEVLRHVLEAFGPTSASVASYNNHWGVPLSLARLPRGAKFGIFEVGMNNPGEVTPLAEMIAPHIAIITAIAPAHIGRMGSLEAIAKEKACIFEGLSPEGVAIIPADSIFFSQLKAKALQHRPDQVISVGESGAADVKLVDYQAENSGVTVTFVDGGRESQSFQYPLLGRHLSHAALIVLATAKALTLDTKKVLKRLATVTPVHGRGKLHTVSLRGHPVKVMDDSYNANLHSTLAAIETLATLKPSGQGRRIVVLGEMLELGSYAIDHHQQVANACQDKGIDRVYFCGGSAMKPAFESLSASRKGDFFSTAQELIAPVLKDLQANDIVLIKGSNGSQVSLVADALIAAQHKDKD
jgi:UDP-N-acetylmuramoyl-tripeptide--D-alanyl-D-alanine ligase